MNFYWIMIWIYLFLFLGWLHLLICKKRGWKWKAKDILINLTIWFSFGQNMREIWRESLVTLMMMWYQVILWETSCHIPNSRQPKIWPMTPGQRFNLKGSPNTRSEIIFIFLRLPPINNSIYQHTNHYSRAIIYNNDH